MDFATHLLADLRAAEAMDAWQRAADTPAAAPDLSAQQLRRLALLRTEMMLVGATLAIVSSLSNWRLARPGAELPCSMHSFQPATSNKAQTTIDGFDLDEPFFDLQQYWSNLTARLTFARNLTLDAGLSLDRQSDIFADAWQRTARAWIACHGEIARLMETGGLRGDSRFEADIVRNLQRCALGEHACISMTGELEIPGWAERRRETRYRTDIPIIVEADTQSFAATLANVSTHGMLLVTGHQIALGSHVAVILPDQRRISGFVAWTRDSKVGITLPTPLEMDPSLLANASKE